MSNREQRIAAVVEMEQFAVSVSS